MKKTKKYKDGGNLFLSMAGGGSMGTIPSMYGELPEYLVGGPGDPENPYVVTGIDPKADYERAMNQYNIDYMRARYADIASANPRTLQDRIPYPTMPMTERQQRRVEQGKNPSTFFKYYPEDPSFAGTRDLNRWSNQTMENAGLSGFDPRFRKELPSPEEMAMEDENEGGKLRFNSRSGSSPRKNYDTGASRDAQRRNSKVKECKSCKQKRKYGYRQFGGDGDDSQMSADQDFYSKKLNAFINKIRENDESGRMQEYERIMAEGMPEEAMGLEARYGLQMPAYNPYQTQDLYDGSNLNLYANAVNGAKGISQGLSDFKNRARLFGPKVQYYNIKNKFHEGYSPDVLKAQEEMNEKINQMNNGFAYGGPNLPKANNGLEQFKKNQLKPYLLSNPIDFNNIGSGSTSGGTGSNSTTGNQTVTINGQQFLIGPDNQLYAPFTGGGYANPNMLYSNPNMLYDGYNDYRGNMNMPYLNFRSRNRLTGDFRDAMMAGMYNDSQLTASMVNSRRALLPGNRVKSMIYQFGELPTGTGTGTGAGTSGAGTQPGAEYTDQDPGKGFFGRLFGNRYNDSRFDPGTDNAGNPEIKRTDLTSQFNPTARSEYDVFRPRRAERVSDRLENVGNKLDRMYGYKQYMEDLNTAYEEPNPDYNFSKREQNRVGRLTKKYNRIATRDNRPVRLEYAEPIVTTQKNGGSLPGYNGIFGSSTVLNNPVPALPDSILQNYPTIGMNNFLKNQPGIQYPTNPYLPGDKKWQQDEEELNDDPYYVEQKLSRKKTLFNPDRFLAKERFIGNVVDQANNARMAEQLAIATHSGNLFKDLPMSRGFYNPQSGKFMGDVPVFNTGFSGYMNNGGSVIDNLKEGDEVPLTAEQIKELEKRGITFSYLD